MSVKNDQLTWAHDGNGRRQVMLSANGGELRRRTVTIMGSEEGANGVMRDYLKSSGSFSLRHWGPADPELLSEAICSDLVLLEACTGAGESPNGNRPKHGKARLPDRVERSDMGRRNTARELIPISRPGLECLRLLKRKRAELPIIMFSEKPDLAVCMRCFQAAADGYFVAPGTPKGFENLLIDAMEGWKPFSREIQRLMAERLAWYSLTGPAASLTQTEVELIWCFANGLANKDISELRNVSGATIHSLSCNIFRKLKVNRRADAVRAVLRF